MPQKTELANPSLQPTVVSRAVPTDERRVPVPRMASQLHDFTGNSRQPANHNVGIGHARRIGDSRQPIIARESNLVLALGMSPSQVGKERPLDSRSGDASDHGPGLTNPAEIRQQPFLAQDL